MNEDRKRKGIFSRICLTSMIIAGLFVMGSNKLLATSLVTGSSEGESVQQQVTSITGVVVDTAGDPVIGASVMEKGTANGTITNLDGQFVLSAREGTTLIISYIGYRTQEIKASRLMKVTLQEDSKLLDEVVVVGYGSMKKANLTGAVASVDVEKTLSSRPIADVGRGLQGTVPGLSVQIPTGEIGSDPVTKIRRQVASPNGDSTPLILVDNVEIPSIQMINPDDIESITVLKDAASASIYGAKAAFGVVLITTKKGAKTESVSITYSGNFSWQNRAKKLEMATIDGLQYVWDAAVSRNPENPSTAATGNMWKMNAESIARSREWLEKYSGKVKASDPVVYNRDWYVDELGNKMGVRMYNAIDAMVKEWTPTQTHNLSLNGRSGKTGYNVGLGLLDQSGMTKPAKYDDFKRYNASVSLATDVNKYLTVRAGAMYSDRQKRYPSVGSTSGEDP